jgi:predicted DCC family thiol-disulfide oxidoreductase YuxK
MQSGPEASTVEPTEKPLSDVVFFDGVCGLCNRLVQFLLREDHDRKFLFSPLQGETIKHIKGAKNAIGNNDTIVVLCASGPGGRLLVRSDAAIYIFSKLPRFRWLSRIGSLFPRFLRDMVYRLIAAIRYKLWGKSLRCRVATAQEIHRFIP